ncbi:radical SAM/SPASM domain-containing protein [Clostridium zeae]|uniref:Radical SAM/SPASM domain-containing protein n=1 Tax=Clostridium zeae TaxID=2759022 RepID=A0ABQ1E8Y6_9CLOT|nr:radical SAM protein [Clostridium zeae]GFZ31224.1 radical SAM/SPASM domain-containing protein [Clostridium zeae]
MHALKENILLRLEYFGGILINKDNFSRYQLNSSEAIFLRALEKVGDIEKAAVIHDDIINNKDYDIDKFLKMGVIEEEKSIKDKFDINIQKVIETIKQDYSEIRKHKFLSAPLELTIYPTLKCNLNCKFCFLQNKISNEITCEKWIETISQAKEMGVLSISILGGEPALYKNIDELLNAIESIGIKTTITTNGSKLKDSTKEILLKSKFITPVISLQCLSEKNKYLMGLEYTDSLETIEFFLRNNKPVRINSVYSIQTIEEFYEMIDYVAVKNIDRYSIATYVKSNENNDIKVNRTLLDSRVLSEKLEQYIEDKYGDKKINFLVEGCLIYSAYPEIIDEISGLSEFDKLYYGCRASKSKLEIYSNGDIYPCICFENLMKPTSNILEKSLSYIWRNDSNFNIMRNDNTSAPTCIKCGFNIFCNGGCPATKQKLYGKKYNEFKDPNCCIPSI